MKTKIKILHLEDSPSDAILIRNVLKKEQINFELLVVDTEQNFVKELTNFSPDVILADHSLPSFNSYDALDICYSMGIKVPFIIITATMSEEFAVDVLKRGASDYILKDRPHRLPAAIQNCLEKFQLEVKQQNSLNETVKNEKRYHAILENIADGIMILSAEGKPTYASSTVKKILGYTEAEIMQMDIFTIAHADDHTALASTMKQVLLNPGIAIKGHTGRMLHKNGTWRWIEATVTNMLHDPAINGIIDNFRDITDKKLADEKILHISRLYAFLSQINQTIVHITNQQDLFDKVCSIAVEYGKFSMAWIGIGDPATKTISLVASSGATDTDKKMLTNYVYDPGGPIDKTQEGLDYYVVSDIKKEVGIRWNKYLEERGAYSGISLAIRKSEKVIATLTIYSTEVDFFNDEEIALLKEAVMDISFALDVLENAKLKLEADERLEESEINLQAIFESTSEGFILTDLQGIIKIFNQQAMDITLLNVKKEIKIGVSIFEYIHEYRAGDYDNAIAKVLLGETLQYDYPYDREDGEIRWFSFTVNPVYSKGTITALSITSADITERKLSVQALIKSEAKYRRIVETAQEGIWVIDINNKTIFVNNRICEILGYSENEMLGKEIFYFLDDEIKKDVENALERRTKGMAEILNHKYVTKSGKRIWANVSANPIFDENGIYIGELAMVTDITDKKNLEDLLDKTNHLARIGNWELNTLNNSIYWSSITKDLHEVSEDYVPDLETSINFYKEGSSRDAINYAVSNAIENGIAYDLELQIITANGNERWFRVIGEPEMRNGDCLKLYGSFQDIETAKKCEIELIQLNEQLRNLTAHLHTIREEERTNIAREVHDELGQQMTSLKMDIAWVDSMLKDRHPVIVNKLNDMLEMTNETIRTIRRIVIELRPGILDDLGLEAAIEWQAKEFENRNGLVCVFNSSVKTDAFSSVINTTVFRIFQESLTNIIRHSKATHVVVNLLEEDKTLILELMDNGIGISDIRKNNKLSFGLMGMKERAAIIKGSFDIKKMDEQGTIVTLKIPL